MKGKTTQILTHQNQPGKVLSLATRYCLLLLVTLCLSLNPELAAQDSAFKMLVAADRNISLSAHYEESGIVYRFKGGEQITGLAVSGQIHLNSDTSLVRIILVDREYKEYLVYETYTLLSGSGEIKFQLNSEETAHLDRVIPAYIRLELQDASCYLTGISTAEGGSFSEASYKAIRKAQVAGKIARVRENIHRKQLSWTAGETSISQLSYAEKKELFGGTLPNLYGFEFYTGGIFTMPQAAARDYAGDTDSKSENLYVSEFDWRNRHGRNWVSSARTQGDCGSCWAFSTTAATEVLASLYFNRDLELDLSEQHLIASVDGSSCSGGHPGDAFRYIRSHGIVTESCLPYQAENSSCDDMCESPEELIAFEELRYFADKSEETLKQYVMSGAVSLGIRSWRHTVALVGFKTLGVGDTIRNQQDGGAWHVITEEDSLAGKTAWIIKNSWGDQWGDGGFAYLVLDMCDVSSTYQISGRVTSLNLSEADVLCTDADGDGYYYWGTGPKPAHCPPCPDEADSDDSDPCVGPADSYGIAITTGPNPPAVSAGKQCEFGVGGALVASGEEIRWYSDAAARHLISTEDTLVPGVVPYNKRYFYATQTVDGCESATSVAEMYLIDAPNAPVIDEINLCDGELLPDSSEASLALHWYSEPEVSETGHKTSSVEESPLSQGVYQLFAAHYDGRCESEAASVFVVVNELPDVDLGADKVIGLHETVLLNPGSAVYDYTWFDGDQSGEREIMGSELGIGTHTLWVRASDAYSCSAIDSAVISVEIINPVDNIAQRDFSIYPNPSNGIIHLHVDAGNLDAIRLIVIDQSGKEVWSNPGRLEESTLDLSDLTAGIYFLQVFTDQDNFVRQLILQ